MSLHKLTAGDGYTYLTRQVAVGDATDRGAFGLADYYVEKGESPGRWWGSGLAGVGLAIGDTVTEAQMKSLFGEGRHPEAEAIRVAAVSRGVDPAEAERATRLGLPFRVASGETEFARRVAAAYAEHNVSTGAKWSSPIDAATRARIRTRIAEEMFVARYGRAPADERERHGFVAQQSRQRTTSVAGFDLTFTPVKSVSALWALADGDTAREIERAHAAAVQHTLAWLEENVLFTRRGHHGVRQVRTRGLIATAFTHRDSRAGDPNLHTHVAISNRVQDESGRWLAVDARVLFKANVTLSEHYNTRLEAELGSGLALRFSDRATSGRGRPTREVVGVDARIAEAWSRRRRDIDGRRGELVRQFQADHGRPPTPVEAIALNQQANLETRQAKHSPRSEQEQRDAWAAEAARVMGSADVVRSMVRRCLSPARSPRQVTTLTTEWIATTAERVVRTVEADRATWQVWHLRAEAERQVRYADLPLTEAQTAIDAIVRHATQIDSIAIGDPDPAHRVVVPAPLLREDGTSVYTVHGARRFTSQRILNAETAILEAAARCDGRTVSSEALHVFTAHAEGVHGLSDEQRHLVVRLAGASPRVQVALAPAGTGKTTCMRALADLWTSDGGRVVGLAPSAAAAHQLRESLSPDNDGASSPSLACDTLAKLAWDVENSADPLNGAGINQSTLVIIDEAGMAGTIELATVVQYVVERGGTVRLVGDDRQLASVSAGGIVRDIADRYGAATLTDTRRFTDPVEGAATLALRDGDPTALGFYADHDRLHVGDPAHCAEQAYQAWREDLAAGRSSVLIAPTRELVSELNARAQRDRHDGTKPAPTSLTVELGDGSRAKVGDAVITRRNDRRLPTGATDWVKNGDRWTVTGIEADGSLQLRHAERRSQRITVPAEYAAHHVDLGYATTIHGAQGLTVDTAHAVLAGDEDRSLIYVALTRGRQSNHAYVSTAPGVVAHTNADGPAWHDLVTHPDTLAPPTAIEILTAAIARDPQTESASATSTNDTSPSKLLEMLQIATDRYRDALYVAAERHFGAATVQDLTDHATSRLPGLQDEPAWDALRANLLLTALETARDPVDLLDQAIERQPLDSARDVAAVLSARILDQAAPSLAQPPLPWLPATPAPLATDPIWRNYLAERSTWVADLAARAAQATDIWSDVDSHYAVPGWARPLLDSPDTTLVGDLAIWRAAEDVDTAELAPTGRAIRPGATGREQRALDVRVRAALNDRRSVGLTLPDEVLRDPWLPALELRLGELSMSGVNVQRTVADALDITRPLPAEVPAAALWWRTQRHLAGAGPEDEPHPIESTAYTPDPRWQVDSDTTYDRIVELHATALDYYRSMYPRSWAPAYLTNRLYEGWDQDITDVGCGYAPPGPFALGQHLLARGATEQELLDAGLARHRELPRGRQRLIDTFRDRLVLPLHDPRRPELVVGFVGRRNPNKDDDPYGGPKYLNTRTTAAYAKADNLFGINQLVARPYARPALVEGPLDALAVTLATRGDLIGIAPLGTAITDQQVEILHRHCRHQREGAVLMYDGDDAGVEAALRARRSLEVAKLRTETVLLPGGLDPCQLLHDLGPTTLAEAMRVRRTGTETPRSPHTNLQSGDPASHRLRAAIGQSRDSRRVPRSSR
jgi:DNA primase catalytic core